MFCLLQKHCICCWTEFKRLSESGRSYTSLRILVAVETARSKQFCNNLIPIFLFYQILILFCCRLISAFRPPVELERVEFGCPANYLEPCFKPSRSENISMRGDWMRRYAAPSAREKESKEWSLAYKMNAIDILHVYIIKDYYLWTTRTSQCTYLTLIHNISLLWN